jgi:hypothetical protein
MVRATSTRVRLALGAAAWLAAAFAGEDRGVRAEELENLAVSSRSVQGRNGTTRSVTLRATFDATAAAAFDPREDAVSLTLGADAAFRIEPHQGRWSFRRGKVRWRGGRSAASPSLRRIVVWPALGTLRAQIRGVASTVPLLGQDPLPIVLQLGGVRFDTLYSTGTTTPRGTPIAFSVTDDWPETQVCSQGTVIVNDAFVWEGLWTSHSLDARPRPAVDFGASVVVGVFLGPRAGRRYAARISRIEERANDVLVTYTETRPPEDCLVTGDPICLFAFATIPRTSKQIVFAHEVELLCITLSE